MIGGNVGDVFCELWVASGGQANNGGSCGSCVNYSNGIVGCSETYIIMDSISTNNQIQGTPVYFVNGPASELPCMDTNVVTNPPANATYDCEGGTCTPTMTGTGQYPDYLSCYNDCEGAEDPSARFDAKVCGCSDAQAPPGYSCSQVLGNTMPTPGSFTIDNQTPVVGDYMTSHCAPGLSTWWGCTWEVTNIITYGYPAPSYNRPSATECLCPRGMIASSSTDWDYCKKCFNGNPTPSITGDNCECCEEVHEDTWDCEKQVSWEAPIPDTYKCVLRTDGSGQFTTLQDCKNNCDTDVNILLPDDPKKKSVEDKPLKNKELDYIPDSETPIDNALKEEVNKIKKLYGFVINESLKLSNAHEKLKFRTCSCDQTQLNPGMNCNDGNPLWTTGGMDFTIDVGNNNFFDGQRCNGNPCTNNDIGESFDAQIFGSPIPGVVWELVSFDNPVNSNTPFDRLSSNNPCGFIDIPGCMDPLAINYNPVATVDDGSCILESNIGCTDPGASNYCPTCTNPCAGFGAGPPCSWFWNINNPGQGGLNCCCEYIGCTDPTANNFCPNCNIDNGTCEYDETYCDRCVNGQPVSFIHTGPGGCPPNSFPSGTTNPCGPKKPDYGEPILIPKIKSPDMQLNRLKEEINRIKGLLN